MYTLSFKSILTKFHLLCTSNLIPTPVLAIFWVWKVTFDSREPKSPKITLDLTNALFMALCKCGYVLVSIWVEFEVRGRKSRFSTLSASSLVSTSFFGYNECPVPKLPFGEVNMASKTYLTILQLALITDSQVTFTWNFSNVLLISCARASMSQM